MVDSALYSLANCVYEPVRSVTLPRLTRSQEVTSSRSQEIAACKYTWANHISTVEDALPGHVHVIRGATASHACPPLP